MSEIRGHAGVTTATPGSLVRPRPYGEEWTIDHALHLAHFGHQGQVDKLGVPYVKHPIEVQHILWTSEAWLEMSAEDRLVAESAALMHDLMEDTPLNYNLLTQLGVPGRVLRVVALLTRLPFNEPRHMKKKDELYYADIAADHLALPVKLADIEHNTRPSRVRRLDAETRARLDKKYAKALDALTPKEVTDEGLHPHV